MPEQAARIRFRPELPVGRRSLLKNFVSGNLCKFYVVYERAFWTEKGFSGELGSGREIEGDSK